MKNAIYKAKHRVKRYGPWELLGTLGAMIFWYLWYIGSGNNEIVGSFAGTWWENIGYYGYNIWQEYSEQSKLGKRGWKVILATLKDIVTEFWLSELLDSFFIRPGAMYLSSQIIPNFWLALFVGKIAADIIFYIPTTYFYQKTLKRDINDMLKRIEDKI